MDQARGFRFNYFKKKWTSKTLKPYQRTSLAAIHKLYGKEYQDNLTDKALQTISDKKDENKDILTTFLNTGTVRKDDFDIYINAPTTPLSESANLFGWWSNSGSTQLTKMVFNILSIPAMSAETERVFSGAKLTISQTRNSLGEDIIEATECPNRWYKAGI